MALFSSAQWEDMNEPLRNITHPDTPKLLSYNIALLVIVAVASLTITPSFLTGVLISGLGFWVGMRNLIVNNTQLNPISAGLWKNLVNITSITVFLWVAFYLIACLATEMGTLLVAVTPTSGS